MLSMKIEGFDAISTGLKTGVNLIEASAGTGKTYAIAMLVLRFVVEQDLDIKRILVVTFTKAATAELKERIRSRLAEARMAVSGYADAADIDGALSVWLRGLELDIETIRYRLDLALLDIDQAAVFTIHGFCQRVLGEHALESGQMFDCELSGDIAGIRLNCADDFWRKQLYQRPVWQVTLLTSVFSTPDALLDSVSNIGTQHRIYPDDDNLDALLDSLQALMSSAAACLPAILQKLENAFPAGLFNESYIKSYAEKSQALKAWLADPNVGVADFTWITAEGLKSGLNGRKFMASKARPLPGDQQKQLYLTELDIDTGVFDQLAMTLQNLQVTLRRALLNSLGIEVDKALRKQNLLSFDDLITRLAEILSNSKGRFLIAELQQRFAAALIDEFQDTDHYQWQIFSKIFAASGHFLYLIGDPKQAIYKFRGADIYSYFAAQQQAEHYYTLQQNWRSHPQLVVAINRLFTRPKPFLFEQLGFSPVTAARSNADGQITGKAPLVFWQLDKNSGNLEHWSAGKAGQQIRSNVVGEILDLLLNDTRIALGPNSVALQPRDIAVLVRSNAQAREYQQALGEAGIPSVLNSKQSVFASVQAQQVYTVLQAVAKAGQISFLKQALCLNWFGLDGQALYKLGSDEILLGAWLNRFQDYQQRWQQQGVYCMMQQLLEQEQVEAQLCHYPEAERQLTNIHHIIERVQQACIDGHLSMNKALDWLRRAILKSQMERNEDSQLRLESDDDAVKIITVHSSKGLEYPVVFCPNLWHRSDGLKRQNMQVICHEDEGMVADLGSEHFAERRQQALTEELAEDLRLFYVAVTRAKFRCYIAWADVRSKDSANDSAMAYLLDFGDSDFSGQQRKLTEIAAEQPECIQYQLLQADRELEGNYRSRHKPPDLGYRQRTRDLFTQWQMSSYTALSALSVQDSPELPEDKAVEPSLSEIDDDNLPKGVLTGNVVHSLLETISFQALATGSDIAQERDQTIRRYGLSLEKPESIDRLLRSIVTTPLSDDQDFCLKNIAPESCLKEMPFYLSMRENDTRSINRILAESPAYQPLTSKQMSGYLTGFIDLVCLYQGKYYVMDYKTNSLGDYRSGSLQQAMREHNYALQYWLYSLVLDRYLRQRLHGYEYSRYFGGIKYLFVRGMNVDSPGSGVYTDMPAEDKINALAEVFFGQA